MKKQTVNTLISKLIYLGLFVSMTSCNDDLFITNTFEGTDKEEIVLELKDVPAYVSCEDGKYVSSCYAEYAYEFYTDREKFFEDTPSSTFLQIEKNVMDKRIGVAIEDYDKYKIPIGSKVYVSAQVTNRGRIFDEEDWQFDKSIQPIQRKAYLTGLRIRNN